MNRALEGSVLKLDIQRTFFLTFLSKIIGPAKLISVSLLESSGVSVNFCLRGVRWLNIPMLDLSSSDNPIISVLILQSCFLTAITRFLASLLVNLDTIGFGPGREESLSATRYTMSISLKVT